MKLSTHIIEFIDSNYNLVDKIGLDINVYKLTMHKRTKHISKEILEKWLVDNNVFSKHRVISEKKYKRDGIEITLPSKIRLTTEVRDDRNLLSTEKDVLLDKSGVTINELLKAFDLLNKM